MNVIDVLNEARGMELQGIMQYMSQHYYLANYGFTDLAGEIKKIAIAEMKHAEKLGERIRDLDGTPLSNPAAPLVPEQTCEEIFSFNVDLEKKALARYNEMALFCRAEKDEISADLLEDLLEEEQEHFNYFLNVEMYIERFGDAYLAMQAKGR